MRFNGEALGYISSQWISTIEGILLIKQKGDTFFKRTSGFEEHWCRLRGNLLLILRTTDPLCVDLFAVVFLENCVVSTDIECDVQNSFRIDFPSGESSILLASRLASESKAWCKHLASAGLSALSNKLYELREEIRIKTGNDPLDLLKAPINPAILDDVEFTVPGIELQMTLTIGRPLMDKLSPAELFYIRISFSSDGVTDLTTATETKLVLSSLSASEANFSETVKIKADDFTSDSCAQFLFICAKDKNSSKLNPFAHTKANVKALQSPVTLQLQLFDDFNGTPWNEGAYLSINVKHCLLSLKKMDIHSKQLRNVCNHVLSRNYVFKHSLGVPMQIAEYVGESKLCFQFPVEYLKLIIQQEHFLYESLCRTGMCNPTLECLRKERLLGMKTIIENYEFCLRNVVDNSGTGFKSCSQRTNCGLDFIPVNLHINRIALLDSDSNLVSFHDVTSVGAFSTSLPHTYGGLFHTVQTSLAPNRGQETSAQLLALASSSPLAACVLQSEGHPVGRAIGHLARGAALVVYLRSDLFGLPNRLSTDGQATLLARRLEKAVSCLARILEEAIPSSPKYPEMENNYDALLQSLVRLITFETLESAELSYQTRHEMMHSLEVNSASDALPERERLLQEVSTASRALETSVAVLWESAEESLWGLVLTALAEVAVGLSNSDPSMPTHSHPNGLKSENMTLTSNLFDSLLYRHHAVVCQALTSCFTALLTAVPLWSTMDWERILVCGLLLHFEGLLSCYGLEIGLLEDWFWAVEYLAQVRVMLRPSVSLPVASARESEDSKFASSTQLITQLTSLRECTIMVSEDVWKTFPQKIQARGQVSIQLRPIAFNVGINEQQTIAEKLEKTSLQRTINICGLTRLQEYFQNYTKNFDAPPKTARKHDVCDLMSSLKHLIYSNRSKPVEILELAAEISPSLNAIRFTSCKSAKDRTAMSITLEHVRWLRDVEWMHVDEFTPALKCLRSTGLRLDVVAKNTNLRKYAFSRLQLLSFPKLYRPPVGTYSMYA